MIYFDIISVLQIHLCNDKGLTSFSCLCHCINEIPIPKWHLNIAKACVFQSNILFKYILLAPKLKVWESLHYHLLSISPITFKSMTLKKTALFLFYRCFAVDGPETQIRGLTNLSFAFIDMSLISVLTFTHKLQLGHVLLMTDEIKPYGFSVRTNSFLMLPYRFICMSNTCIEILHHVFAHNKQMCWTEFALEYMLHIHLLKTVS